MGVFRQFLELSTIHGLYHISTGRKWSRLFWILVVIGCFTWAGYLIYSSFFNWGKSPITTTVETSPISEMIFPNITVCPPKNSFLNLNYDIMQGEKAEFTEETRAYMIDDLFDKIQHAFFKEVMTNQS